MRNHTAPVEPFLQSLALSIAKDPASLAHWWCLHIKRTDESQAEARAAIMQRLKEVHRDVDCDVVQCRDHDILLISRNVQDERLHAIADEFSSAAFDVEGLVAECTLYDLARDTIRLQALLEEKASTATPLPPLTPRHDFGEVASLADVFMEAKKLRSSRQPLHVMVVEDDPLTRRLVTTAFKERYAVISASNAQEAVMNYMLHAPDIVFLDIGLPDASGLDVLGRLMSCDQHAYVVMFSGNSYLDNVTAALSHGASGFIAKPFKKETMSHYIEQSAIHHHKYHA